MLCIGVGWLVVREKKCGRIDSPAHTPQGFLGLNSDMFSCYYERETYGGIYYINKCSRGKWGKNNIPKRDQAIRVSYHIFLIEKRKKLKQFFIFTFVCLKSMCWAYVKQQY